MANKIIREEELRDPFLSALIRSEEPVNVPEGFSDDVMKRIALLPKVAGVKPYVPPIWLKWGIPGFFIASLIGLLISGQGSDPAANQEAISFVKKMSVAVNSWFSGIKFDIQAPDVQIPQTALWVISGAVVLVWGFILLSRFLEKKVRS